MPIDAFHMRGATTVVAKIAGVTRLTSRTNDHRRGRSSMRSRMGVRKGHGLLVRSIECGVKEFDICAQWVSTYQNSGFPSH